MKEPTKEEIKAHLEAEYNKEAKGRGLSWERFLSGALDVALEHKAKGIALIITDLIMEC